jgi:hypothetical protein
VPFGSVEVPTAECPVIIRENDCIVIFGETPRQAHERLELLESTARSLIYARSVAPFAVI